MRKLGDIETRLMFYLNSCGGRVRNANSTLVPNSELPQYNTQKHTVAYYSCAS